MKERKIIYFRADASSKIGYGHFIRSLALAHILKDTFSCIFVTVDATEYQILQMKKLGTYIILPSETTHFEDFLSILTGSEIVVLDNYFFDVEYQKKIKNKGNTLICIDDRKNIEYFCDVLINHVIGIKKEDIITLLSDTLLCLGIDFALMRPCFIKCMKEKYTQSKNTNNILVAMGGTDYSNYSYMIAKYLLENTDCKIQILIGDGYKYISSLCELEKTTRVQIHKNLEEEKIIELIKDVLLVVSPPSTFAYEVCSVGRPLIVGSFALGHADVAHLLESYNLALNCGNLETMPSSQFIELVEKAIKQGDYYINNQKDMFNGSQPQNLLNIFKFFL